MTAIQVEVAVLHQITTGVQDDLKDVYRAWDNTVSNADIHSSFVTVVRMNHHLATEDLPLSFKNYLGHAVLRPTLRRHPDEVATLMSDLLKEA